MSIDVQAAREAGFTVEYMPPPPPDYPQILSKIYHVLRGTETVISNGMLPEHYNEAIYRGCISGLVTYLADDLAIQENQVGVILHAIGIQREVARR